MKSTTQSVTTGSKWPRILLAGPLTFVCALIIMVGSSAYIPEGAAKLNNIALPLALFPAIWATLFFYSCLTTRLFKAFVVLTSLLAFHSTLVVMQLNGIATS